MTDFSNKTRVLGEAYTAQITDSGWLQFKSYCDVGLPLAYLVDSNIVDVTPETQDSIEAYIEETYALLMDMLEVPLDERDSFENFDDLVAYFDN